MAMLRHPLSGTKYHLAENKTVRVVGKNGVEGQFSECGTWIAGDRRTADPGLAKWMANAELVNITRRRLPTWAQREESEARWREVGGGDD